MILAFRPNGRTTFKSLQKVLTVSYMRAMHQQIVKVDGSLENFIQRHQSIFHKVCPLCCTPISLGHEAHVPVAGDCAKAHGVCDVPKLEPGSSDQLKLPRNGPKSRFPTRTRKIGNMQKTTQKVWVAALCPTQYGQRGSCVRGHGVQGRGSWV